eukprot:gene847-392_t
MARTTVAIIPTPTSMEYLPGTATLSGRICAGDGTESVAEALAGDLAAALGVAMAVDTACTPPPADGDVALALQPCDRRSPPVPDNSYRLQLGGGPASLRSCSVVGLHHASVSLLQWAYRRGSGSRHTMPAVTITDTPYRFYRALMIDVKGGWHSDLKQFVVLCRLYKIPVLTLHTSPAQWMGSVMASVDAMPPPARASASLYSPSDMASLLDFAASRGVLLVPHLEATPGNVEVRAAMTTKFNPASSYVDFVDEVDRLGPYPYPPSGQADARWWGFMNATFSRVYAQFAARWPGGVLPYVHVGPVLGENGMSPGTAARFHGIVASASGGAAAMEFWDGPDPGPSDPLHTVAPDLTVQYYTKQYGPPVSAYLQQGWPIVNAAWTPLYLTDDVQRTPQQMWADLNYFRFGTGGHVTMNYSAVVWDVIPPTPLVRGLRLTTWSMRMPGHSGAVRPRLPLMSERSWNYKTWPSNDSAALPILLKELGQTDELLQALLPSQPSPPAPLGDADIWI